MIKPTVGRVVWFYPPVDGGRDPNGQPLAAMIAKVIDDRHINIGALFGDGTHFAAQDVVLVQEGDEHDPDQAYACWMPYQMGQAAKAEKLELQIAGAGSADVAADSTAQPTGAALTSRLVNFEANGSLKASDAEAASHAIAPRVTLADIEGAIAERHDVRAGDAVGTGTEIGPKGNPVNPLGLLSICILVMKNGFTVVGKSAPASPENFSAEFGKKLAYEDCVRQLWPLMGFALREKLAGQQA